MRKNNSAIDTEDREWSFIGVKNIKSENIESALTKNVEDETKIKIQNIELITKNFYHTRLTDENVNNIQRDELQLLNFFTITEINKLTLSSHTKEMIIKYGILN